MKSLFRIFQPFKPASMTPLKAILPVSMDLVSCLRIGSSEELVCPRAASIFALDIAHHKLFKSMEVSGGLLVQSSVSILHSFHNALFVSDTLREGLTA